MRISVSFFVVVFTFVLAQCSKQDAGPTTDTTPLITSISPASGPFDTSITISGVNFATNTSGNQVTINGRSLEVLDASATQLIVKVPLRMGSGKVKVQTSAGTVEGPTFTFQYTVLVSTLSGTGVAGFMDGAPDVSQFDFPSGLKYLSSTDLIICDRSNNRLRRVSSDGTTSTYSGSTLGTVNGDISVALFTGPNRIAFDSDGSMYISQSGLSNLIRKITSAGLVTTLAGGASTGFVNANGTAARFAGPSGIAVDLSKNVYVADFANNAIRKITPSGDVTTLAGDGTSGFMDGTGSSAKFNLPLGMDIDISGNLIVADFGNHRIRKVTQAGVVTTVAGNGIDGFLDGPSSTAEFNLPRDLAIDLDGNIYVVDGLNNAIRIITISGNVVTLAGNGASGSTNGNGSLATFNNPYAIDILGEIMIVGERDSPLIRKLIVK